MPCDASLWWRCRVTGFAGTSIDEVAAATGLGKGSLYGAFGDKRQLDLRVFDRYCTEVTEATVRSLDGPGDGACARLSGMFSRKRASRHVDFAYVISGRSRMGSHRAGCVGAVVK